MDVEAGTLIRGGGDLGDGWEFCMSIQFNLVMLFSGVSRWGKQGSK